MALSSYEPLPYKDASFPIIFHLDDLSHPVEAHWHESIELLFCLQGTAELFADTEKLTLHPGELTVINSGALHYIPWHPGDACLYYCLIVDPSLLEGTGLPVGTRLHKQVKDPAVETAYMQIVQELQQREPYYKEAAKSAVQLLFSRLYRRWADTDEPTATANHAPEMVKKALLYLKNNFKENISIDDVCGYVGFSKYYFCRCFRQVTGRSVMEYVQDLRCAHAQKLLETGNCTVSECAAQCGFSDVSYFTKVFKRQTGRLPSQAKRAKNAAEPSASI